MSQRLPNYVRTARKGAGLSARDLATLLGRKSAGSISRYEGFGRSPTLKSAIMLEVALGAPLSEIFPTVYEDARERVVRQAESILERLKSRTPAPLLRMRINCLRKLVERISAAAIV